MRIGEMRLHRRY